MAMELLSGIRAIAFDFDGTLVDSDPVKEQVFRELFSEYGKKFQAVVSNYYRASKGSNRREKFSYLYSLLGKNYTEKEEEMLVSEFRRLSIDRVASAEEIRGAVEFLKEVAQSHPLYIVSSADESDLLEISERRGIKSFFKKIFGAPMKKHEALSSIVQLESVRPHEVLYFGDAPEDYEVAKKLGVRFCGINMDERNLDYSVYRNFDDLLVELD